MVQDGILYAGYNYGQLNDTTTIFSYDLKEENIIWEQKVLNAGLNSWQFLSVDKKLVYPTYNKDILIFDSLGNKSKIKLFQSSKANPVGNNDVFVIYERNRGFAAYSLVDNSIVWESNCLAKLSISQPILKDSLLFFASYNNTLELINVVDGNRRVIADSLGGVLNWLCYVDQGIAIVTQDTGIDADESRIMAYELSTGKLIWKDDLHSSLNTYYHGCVVLDNKLLLYEDKEEVVVRDLYSGSLINIVSLRKNIFDKLYIFKSQIFYVNEDFALCFIDVYNFKEVVLPIQASQILIDGSDFYFLFKGKIGKLDHYSLMTEK